MKWIAILVLVAGCGQKRNLDRCCVDEADCAAIGLPNGSGCQAGELCRGNECVEQTCTTSSQCDPSAPYCEDEHCAETCTMDSSCPVTSPPQPFCVSGGCVECRDTADCDGLICRDGRCGGCAVDGECSSGLCITSTGMCAESTDVAFVSATGSGTSDCTPAVPCTFARALAIDPPKKTIKLAAGTYTNATTVTITGMRAIVGDDVETTKMTNAGTGPVVVIPTMADVSIDRLEVFGGKNGGTPGIGVHCTGGKLRFNQVRITGNASDGLRASCDVGANQVSFTNNGGFGADVSGLDIGPQYLLERATVFGNVAGGIKATGRGAIRHSFVLTTMGSALVLSGTGPGAFGTRPAVDFTSVSGGNATALTCANDSSGSLIAVTNVVIRGFIENPPVTANTNVCAFSNCVLENSGIPTAGCVQAGPSPVFMSNTDLHLVPSLTNPAINAGAGGTGSIDIDGETRPKGGAADIGGDEAQ